LVTITRQLIEKLQKGELPNFYFDGQSIALEDAVALDPSLKNDLIKLIKDGTMQVGPWYVLNDQMLVCGESVIRNLSHGMKVVRKFGQPTLIGYCPDTFGHSQDLPRILKGFGIDSAVVWRGVPDFYNGKGNEGRSAPLFIWESPDGSQVLAHHLTKGYYQTAFHEKLSTADLAKSLLSWLDNTANYNYWTDGVLVPVGGDHLAAPEKFKGQLDDLNDWFSKNGKHSVVPLPLVSYLQQFNFDHLAEFDESNADEFEVGHLPLVAGELRDNSATAKFERAFLLPGVLSSRLYLKRANRIAENALVNKIEPLCALLSAWGVMNYPQQLIEHAWELLLKNHPHDSICGCSVDAVHQEMMTRYKRIESIVNSIETEARQAICLDQAIEMHAISSNDPDYEPDAVLVVNFGGQPNSGVVELDFSTRISDAAPSDSIVQLISSGQEDKLFAGPQILTYYKVVNSHKGYVYAQDIPPLGFRLYDWDAADKIKVAHKSSHLDAAIVAPPVVATANTITNGLVDLSLTADGLLVVKCEAESSRPGEKQEFVLGHNFIDYGDAGDTYTFDPVVNDQPISAVFVSAKLAEAGPMVGSLLLQYEINIPEQVEFEDSDGQIKSSRRSEKLIKHTIETKVSLRRGSSIVYFDTEFYNKAKDHRLEVVFNTGARSIEHSYSENHFSLVKRRHNNKNQSLPVAVGQEAILDKFPCQRFFIANKQLFLNKGLPEYGINKGEVTITILRAVSMLSRGAMRTRGGGAGPHMLLEEANCIGLNKVSYAWSSLSDEGDQSRAYSLAESYENRLWAILVKKKEFEAKVGSHMPTKNSLAKLSGNNHNYIKTMAVYVQPHTNNVVMRLLNIDMRTRLAKLELGPQFAKMQIVKLSGEILESRTIKGVQSGINLEFAPNELKTIVLIKNK
jgi:hypothetical protein